MNQSNTNIGSDLVAVVLVSASHRLLRKLGSLARSAGVPVEVLASHVLEGIEVLNPAMVAFIPRPAGQVRKSDELPNGDALRNKTTTLQVPLTLEASRRLDQLSIKSGLNRSDVASLLLNQADPELVDQVRHALGELHRAWLDELAARHGNDKVHR